MPVNQASDTDFTQPFLLVVEDDETFRKFLVTALRKNGFPVRECANGLVAKTIFDLNSDRVRLIISDIAMPELDGIELLEHVRASSKVPVIIMTGFVEALQIRNPLKLGATKFIPKPFRVERMLELIDECFHPKPVEPEKSEEPVKEQQRYCPIHIDQFLTASKLLSDIYIRLGEDKYIMVAHKGDAVEIERFKVYQEKKVEFLFVTFADFAAYLDFSVKISSTAAKLSKISAEKKARLLKHTTELMVEKCFLAGVDASIVGPAQKMVEDMLALITEDPDVVELFAAMDVPGDHIYPHAVAVAVISCMVARQCGWTSATTTSRLAIGGLFIDVGLKEVDPALLFKKRFARTAAETKLIESHPARSRDIVLALKGIPEDVAAIVYQHHETPHGTGYPQQIREPEFHRLAKLVATVEHFVECLIPIESAAEPMTVPAALTRLRQTVPDSVDQSYVSRLMEIFGVAVAK